MPTRPYSETLSEALRDVEVAKEYLSLAMKEGDEGALIQAFKAVVDAHGVEVALEAMGLTNGRQF